MIFILNVLLLANVLFAYKFFKNLCAPPLLFSVGMFFASLVATGYYDLWEMSDLSFKTVRIISLGTWLFTLFCCMYMFPRSRFLSSNWAVRNDFAIYDSGRLNMFYVVAIVIGIGYVCLVYKLYRSEFGALALTELVGARREDQMGDQLFEMPSWLRMLGSFTKVVGSLSAYFVAESLFSKRLRFPKFTKLLIGFHFMLSFFYCFFAANKGAIMQLMVIFGIFCFTFIYYNRRSFLLSGKMKFYLLLMAVLLVLSFKGLSSMIGRQVGIYTVMDLFAIYCGAEIKNLDILVSNDIDINETVVFGGSTFSTLYAELGTDVDFGPDAYCFLWINGFNLGNVYTCFYPYYVDFGELGVYVMMFLLATLVMIPYRRAHMFVYNPYSLSWLPFVYADMAISIGMSFFSSRLTESVVNIGWCRSAIYMLVLILFVRYFLLADTRKLRGAQVQNT